MLISFVYKGCCFSKLSRPYYSVPEVPILAVSHKPVSGVFSIPLQCCTLSSTSPSLFKDWPLFRTAAKGQQFEDITGTHGQGLKVFKQVRKGQPAGSKSSRGSWGEKWGKALPEGLGRLTGVLEASPKGSVWISRRLQCKKHERRLQEARIFSAKHTTCFAPQICLAETSLWACKPSISEFKAEAVNCICLLANALKKPYFVHAKRKIGGISKRSSCRAPAEGTRYFLSTHALSRTWGNCKGLWCIPWWQRRPTRQYVRTAGCCTIMRPWHARGSGAISSPKHQPKEHSQSPAI